MGPKALQTFRLWMISARSPAPAALPLTAALSAGPPAPPIRGGCAGMGNSKT
ncbi:hypothetical protein Bwad002_18560 [Bilophila wadsworthia]